MSLTKHSSYLFLSLVIKMFGFAVFVVVTFCIPVKCQTDAVTETNATLENVMPLKDHNGALDESDSAIQRILTNLSILNDDSSEYDTAMVVLLENTTHSCLQRCIEEETYFLNEFGLKCQAGDKRPECYRTRCFKGCELWWQALKEFEPCQEACSSTQFYPFDMPCISACETTQRQYWHFQRLHVERLLTTETTTMTTLLQPQLLHDNETLNTLTLKWPIPTAANTLLPSLYLANRPFNIQYQYVLNAQPTSAASSSSLSSSPSSTSSSTLNDTPDINNNNEGRQQSPEQHEKLKDQQDETIQNVQNGVADDNNDVDVKRQDVGKDKQPHQQEEQWRNLADYNCNENFECDIIDGLMPYTSYKFRFQIPFGDDFNDVLYSEPSEVYKTPAMGLPISQPLITQALALDDTHIAVQWEPGKFISGPLKHYQIVLQQKDQENEPEKQVKQLLKPAVNYVIYSDLLPSTVYKFRVSMFNEQGEGPYSEVVIETKASQTSAKHLEDLNTLIVAGEYSVVLKSLDPLVESRVLYKSEEILTDFDVHQYHKRLFVVDKKGTVVSLFLDDTANYTTMNLEEPASKFVPNKLAVDWLNQKLYVAGRTSQLNSWLLKRVDFNGSGVETIKRSLKPLKHLQVDPLNGWLFAATESFELCRLNLHSLEAEYFRTTFNFELFSNRFQNLLLTSLNYEERTVYELSYDFQLQKRKSWEISNTLQGDILWFETLEDWLIMSNGSFMLRQYLPTQEVDLISFKEIEWCWKVKPLMASGVRNIIQPLPKPMKQPLGLQTVLASTKAKISWQPPVILSAIQTKAAWQRWDYELDILDVASNNAFNIRNIKSEYFQVERLQPSNLYQIKVRAIFAGLPRQGLSSTVYSEWSEELMTRTWPRGDYHFLWASADGLWESEELLESLKKNALASSDIQSMKQVNTSLYYVAKRNYDLKCLNLINPEVLCGFEASNTYSVDYDWRGGQLYWSDIKRNCVIRSDLQGWKKLLMPIFGARVIKVDSLKGYIYYTTESRLVRRKLNGALPSQEVEYYHTSGNGESILGFALDSSTQQIYWWVLQQEIGVKLFTTEVDFVKAKELLFLTEPDKLLPDSFGYLKEIETFIWLKEKTQQVVLSGKESLQQLTQFPKAVNATVNFVMLKQDFVPLADLNIIPDVIDRESVVITEGYWDDFNIKWSVSNSLGNFTTFYRVLLTTWPLDKENILSFEVNQPIVRVTEFKMAGRDINVTILPLTVWAQGVPVTVKLTTPSAAPKQPRNLRVFVDQFREPLQQLSNITALVRWDSPENISSEKQVFYKVYCWFKEDLHSVKDIEDMGLKTHEVRFYNLQKEESYMFQVQAFSLTRSKGGEKTSLLTHFVSPEAQAVPKLMFSTPEFIAEIDLDLNVTKQWVFTSSEVEHLALMSGELRVLWVNENVELMSFQPGASALKLARMRAEVLSLTVDWILRKVYWAEMSGEKDMLVDIYELDLNIFEGKVIMGSKIFSLKPNKLLKNLISLPYSSSLLWLEYEAGSSSTNNTLQGRNLTDLSSLKLKNHLFYNEMFEGSLLDEMETVNLVDLKGKLYSYELQRQLLTTLKIPEQDSTAKFQRDAGFIYSLLNNTLKAFNRRKHNLEFMRSLKEAKLIKAFNYQEYPSRECLILEKPLEEEEPEYKLEQIFLQQVTENSLLLNLWKNNPYASCKLAIPGLKYKVLIKHEEDYEKLFHLSAGKHNITDLKPFTNYTLNISVTSYYQQKFSIEEFTFPTFTVRTQEGNPSQPINFTARAVSPSEILVYWQEPLQLNAESLNYQLYWQVLNSSLTSHKIVEAFEMSLLNLEASQEYLLWLEVYSKPSKLNTTEKLVVKTFAEPEPLQLVEQEAYNLTLLWQTNTDYDSAILECKPLTQEPDISPFSIDLTEVNDNITITNLEPKTKYEFFFKLKFSNVKSTYLWPEMPANYFVFETLGDAPGRPGQPQIEHITGEIFKVFWEPAKENGASIIEYSLEALKSRHHKRIRRHSHSSSAPSSSITMMAQMPYVEELKPVEDKWSSFCNTSELSCIVKELHTMRLLMFRVRARNEPYGWGPYSEDSERVLEPFVSPQKRNSLILAIVAPAAIVTTCVIILFVIRKVQKRRLKAKQLLAKSRPSIWSNFSAMQQQMAARNRAFSMASSATMYTGGPLSDADIALLPHINWSQVTLLNFLGSGAFGEVYEGLLKYEGQEEMEKVAIKSLRKGASEFAELLQEAQLMSNFKHENIISLIGVCCDTESISIIMEHMEAGDLLSYLRESRPNSTKPVASLQLLDLMTMCIDVATGMAYLEDMHFVHRDLACRNCLVSSREPSKRTVKIGDFGLARDIYKNDYYRKEGEALMPVRWMAPESLIDGVFTTQSDVWAFGVLCWEILTLGQQPYAARNNFEVLNYVKEGGRLEQPDNCPDKLFCLMTCCWQTDPDERPSFRKCLNALLAIKTDVRRVSLGYNIDDNDYALYANQHGIVLSSFLTSPNLNKVPDDKEKEKIAYETKQNSLNDRNEKKCILAGKITSEKNSDNSTEKNDLKVRFNNNVSMMKDVTDVEAWNDDESHLIDTKLYKIQENPDYYANEGVSRL